MEKMSIISNSLFLFLLCLASSGVCFLEIQESSVDDDVPPFYTVLKFIIGIISERNDSLVSVTPEQCCLYIEPNDTDCQIMNLGNRKDVTLIENELNEVMFSFINLYVRYRKGNCSFSIISDEPVELSHTIEFDTYPRADDDDVYASCAGIDQDSDRECDPVDCAIKYKGYRNYYNTTIGKCQPVTKCHTRGQDGITVIAYYDWDINECVEYKWFGSNNYLNQIESDTDIPVHIDPSQTKYYPDLEPHLMENSTVILSCNHGVQSGIHCICDKGWMSSGIHRNAPTVFHWCNKPDMLPLSTQQPRKLNKILEYIFIALLLFINMLLFATWIYLSVKLCCPRINKKTKRKTKSLVMKS